MRARIESISYNFLARTIQQGKSSFVHMQTITDCVKPSRKMLCTAFIQVSIILLIDVELTQRYI